MGATLTTVHNAIIECLEKKLGHKTKTITVHSPLLKDIEAPAVLLALEHIHAGKETGDGRTAINCSFTICAILAVKGIPSNQVSIAIVNFAAELLDIIRYNHWDLGADVSHPENLTAQPAEFRPGKAGFESWAVSWEQTVYLGELEESEGVLPDTVMAGNAPDVGFGHEDDYVEL